MIRMTSGGVIMLIAAAVMMANLAGAHDLSLGKAVMTVDAEKSEWQLTLETEVMAIAAGAQPGHLSEPEAARLRGLPQMEQRELLDTVDEFLKTQMALRFDDADVARPENISLPGPAEAFEQNALVAQIRGRTITMTGPLPARAQHVTLQFPELIGPVSVTVHGPEAAGEQNQLLQAGERSRPFALAGGESVSGSAPFGRTVAQYLILGFEHIIPKGLDHILFVLGLFFLSAKWRPLLWQVTAFTLAHTLTLALAIMGVISAPGYIVEPLIALSIAFVAIENIATGKLMPWRPAVVFAFGLLHGMGFAGVLMELGLPSGQLAAALISFNVGVEFGQLAVIGLAFLAVGWFHQKNWYRQRVVVPASAMIAMVGIYWTVERVFL